MSLLEICAMIGLFLLWRCLVQLDENRRHLYKIEFDMGYLLAITNNTQDIKEYLQEIGDQDDACLYY